MNLDNDGTDARFVVSVEDISGAWGVIKPLLESRPAWRNLQLRNKFGNAVPVTQLQVLYVLSSNPRLKRLRQHTQSPVTWFRNPYVQLVLISGDDPDEYKRSLKGQLRGTLDREKDLLGGAPDYVIAYVQPTGVDVFSKGAKKVFESVRSDLGTRKRDRCVRLDVGPRGAVTQGSLMELERQLADALKATFEARQAAYNEEVRKLTAGRQEAGWSFSTLFLVKDSLAIMLESASLLEDALREYAELEALFLETLPPPGSATATAFGGISPGDDNAQLVRATWRESRQSVLRNGVVQFDFQQFLFACQARILLKLNRPAEVAERGLQFMQTFSASLDHETAAGQLPSFFKEAWLFSACLSLASTTVRIGPPPPTPQAVTPAAPPGSALPPLPTGIHRRATSEVGQGAVPGVISRFTRHTKSLNANDFAAISEGSTGDASSATGTSEAAESDEDEELPTPLNSEHRQASTESATLQHRKSLRPVRIGHNNRSGVDSPGSIANGRPPGSRNAHRSRKVSTVGSDWKVPGSVPEINWQLGVPGQLQGDESEEAAAGAWQAADGRSNRPHSEASAKQRQFWCLLGHLYANARQALSALEAHVDTSSSNTSTPKAALPKAAEANGHTGQAGSNRKGHFGGGHIVAPAHGETPAARQPSPPPFSNTSLAATESAISTPKHEQQSRTASDAAPPPQHSRRLSRFGPEAIPRRSDSVNSLVHPHSRRSSVSEMSTSGAFSEAESVGSLVRRSSDPDIQRPEADLRNIHTVEREVETASEDSGSPNSISRSNGLEGSKRSLPWLTDWRLKLALASIDHYQELWIELSGSAAACYTAAGWRRTGELMVSRVAEMLAQRGQQAASAALVQRQARLFLAECWLHLGAQLLHELLESQQLLYQVTSVSVCLRLLSLPDSIRGPAAALEPIQASLVEAAQEQDPLQQVAAAFGPKEADGSVNCYGALWVEPLAGSYSRFFGQSEVDGEPITSASSMGPGANGSDPAMGAPKACVGDVVRLPVSIVSRLPQSLQLSNCQLAISVLQEMTVVVSPRGGNDNQLTRGYGHLRLQSVRSLDSPSMLGQATHPSHRQQQSMTEGGTPGTAASASAQMDAQDQRFGTKWQETEEVACSLVGIGDPGKAVPQMVVIQPGSNTLWFEVSPFKRGLYALKHVTAVLGGLKLKLAGTIPEFGKSSQGVNTDITGWRGSSSLGACDTIGRLGEEAVLLYVDSALQRVGTSAVASHACLIAGLHQWLGVALAPKHDSLADASVQMHPLGPSIETPPAAEKGLVSLSLGGDGQRWIAQLNSSKGSTADEQEREGQVSDSGKASSSGRQAAERCSLLNFDGQVPSWAATQPSLLWLWVQTGTLAPQHEVVRVNPLGSHTPLGALGTDLPSPVKSPNQDMFGGPKGTAELDLNLNYSDGCQRGHTSRLSIPVSPAFRIHVTGKELMGRRVALQLQITSCLSTEASIISLGLDPQPGFSCEQEAPELAALLPLRVLPHGSAHLLLFLTIAGQRAAPERGGASRLNSALELRFRQSMGSCPPSSMQEVVNEWMPSLLQRHPVPGPPHPRPGSDGVEESEEATQRHNFTLDLGAASSAPRSTVYIRLLGPFSARAGEVVTFCWRLERSQAFATEQEGSLLQYEVRAEGEGWRPSGTRSGTVQLPLERSSAATVEAMWVPVSAGMLPMPQLLLPNIPHQEVFDVGDSNHLINVSQMGSAAA